MTKPAHLRLRGPADIATYLHHIIYPYPTNRIGLLLFVAPHNRMGPRATCPLPSDPDDQIAAAATVLSFISRTEAQGHQPTGVILTFRQEPDDTLTRLDVAERLRPLHRHLRQAFTDLGIPVRESLCISAGYWVSYLCPNADCCSPVGTPFTPALRLPQAHSAPTTTHTEGGKSTDDRDS